jgi:hypothetical protein
MDRMPRLPTAINTNSYPIEFQQIIGAKSQNFVGREFVFTAINDFLQKYDRGYFTIVGAPGSGKSAILAKYLTQNPNVIYYNAQIESKNTANQFLTNICTQIIEMHHDTFLHDITLPENATEGSWFLSLLLQQVSDQLEPNQNIIIAIDALDAINRHSQPPGTNLFYLPRYPPERVYFLLTRRPYLKEKSGLLIETPSQILNLEDYPEETREDIQVYLRRNLQESGVRSQESEESKLNNSLLTSQGSREEQGRERLNTWLTNNNINVQEFIAQLTVQSENNFMYLSKVLEAIALNSYSNSFKYDTIPPSLEDYYQNHWQKMVQLTTTTTPICRGSRENLQSEITVAVLNILVQQEKPISVEAIAQIIKEDEYEVEELLENWYEFLNRQIIVEEICYSFYHSTFRRWLGNKILDF